MAAPAPAESGNMLALMGQGALDEQSYSAFANCVQGLGSAYKAYPDEGVLVVIPSTSRAIDIDAADKELWKCIEASSDTVSLAVESSEFHDAAHEASTNVKSIQHTDALNMGVTGQKVVDHVVARSSGLETRAIVNYYAGHHSDENTCRGDFNHYRLSTCISFASAYRSTLADNLDATRQLRYTIWPHHSCQKGNQRTINIRPRSSSACQVRTTYSWNGVYA
ncbi:hypothetical protein V2A60_002506 [Cordyceps javanica]|uniref:Uncharacterized protein n=1 Tax=Cordyceps javanica TaxID=43265 RepID=A0A545UMY6_9HYPO|nr:hypothetical protein IF1G_10567 [Cordyceps javanica]TQW02459.1 hypothetical protein IF2G_10059 [Cordyceps javanica]